ncbi:MAG: protein-disulfide reductase DsbD [Pseudomonas sp.]
MRRLMLFLLLLVPGLAQAQSDNGVFAQSEFLPVEQAFSFTHKRLESGEVRLQWRIAPGYYLYQERLKFESLPEQYRPNLPQGEVHNDEFFGQTEVYREQLQVLLPAGASGPLMLGWQGCADAGLCYPPQSLSVQLDAERANQAPAQATDQVLAGGLNNQALGWSLLVFFGLGLLLAFTPCSLPMLPILAGLVVGSGASPRRGLALASSYVLSMALVYAGLGVLAAVLGGNLQALLQQPWLLGSFAGLFVLLALPMFGLFELQLPAAVRDRLERAGRTRRGGSLLGAGLLGILSGLLVGPCMTAPLAGALLYIAQSGNAVQGGLVLFALGIGIGTPLLLLVTVGNRLLPKPGAWMNQLKGAFGFLFLGTALILVRPLLTESLWVGLWGGWLLLLAYAIRHLLRQTHRLAILLGAASALAGLWGAALVLGAAGGAHDPWQPLQVYAARADNGLQGGSDVAHAGFITLNEPAMLDRQLAAAKARGQWVLVEYYADWCVSCLVMEKQVFADQRVIAALAGVHLLRLDVTADNAASRELLSRHQVPGPPSLLWIVPNGEERRGRRITGEVDAQSFLQQWADTRERG